MFIKALYHVLVPAVCVAAAYFAKSAIPIEPTVKTVTRTVKAKCPKCKPKIRKVYHSRDCSAPTKAFKDKLDKQNVYISELKSRIRTCEVAKKFAERQDQPWGKNKTGDEDLEWFKENVIDPYADEGYE